MIVGDGQARIRRQGDDGVVHHGQLGLGLALGADHVADLHPVLELGGDGGELALLEEFHLPRHQAEVAYCGGLRG